ncbi:hypothetical protein HDU89_000558 [Geranomyces variabilis]|nr:hypothetical protein HDU89_000558 [Geranomyces variabilis]
MNRCGPTFKSAASASHRCIITRSISRPASARAETTTTSSASRSLNTTASQAGLFNQQRQQRLSPVALARSIRLAAIRSLSHSSAARAAATPPPPSDAINDEAASETTVADDPNVTPHVLPLFTDLTHAINSSTAAPDGLRRLAFALRTPADAALFQSALKRWRTAKNHQDRTDNILFFDRLFAVRAYDVLLDMLCDRPAYRLLPDPVHIDLLLKGFREEIQERGGDVNEARAIEMLDQVFKTFAVALYTDVPPTADMYAQVILACLESGTKEGERRALITAKEQTSLGMPLHEDVKQRLAGIQA